MSRPRGRRSPRLGLPADAIAAACAVWAGLALFCVFSIRGAHEYERLAVLMKYQDDAVLKALFMAHKVATAFAATLTIAATAAACLAKSHAVRAHAAHASAAPAAARRRLMAACAACIYVAEFFAIVMAAACAASWGVGHTVQLGIDATASGDNADFNRAVSEALAQAQTKLSARMETSANKAYNSFVGTGTGIGGMLAAPAAKFRDSVVHAAVSLANETARAAVTRANTSLSDPPPPRPPSCENKFCVYMPLRPLFEEGDGLCVCTFEYLARAAQEAVGARGDVLLAFVGALMMCGGFGALLQRTSYWLGATSPHAAATMAARAAGAAPPPPPPPQLTLGAKVAGALVQRPVAVTATTGDGDDDPLPASPSAALVAAEAALAPTPAPRRWWRRARR